MTSTSPVSEELFTYAAALRSPVIDPANRPGTATGRQVAPLEPEFLSWGEGCTVLATLGSVELEYAALRTGCGVFDATCRGTISITGEDRVDFMERMTTQVFADLAPGEGRPAFMLDRTGRILADLFVIVDSNRLLLDVDHSVASQISEQLSEFVVVDDVQIEDVSDHMHRFWLIGSEAGAVPAAVLCDALVVPRRFFDLPGLDVTVPLADAVSVWRLLVHEHGVRPVGWHAMNMTRLEAAEPMFRIDFDQANLPRETGLIADHVRFDKGCYIGQEVVARMESRGRSARSVAVIDLPDQRQPIAGTQVWRQADSEMDEPVGIVTSSAPSPMAGGRARAIAMVKSAVLEGGGEVATWADGERIEAVARYIPEKTGV
ncbi:MAG: glycine cleavage T C-terminal barrel domain-containing protein [Phycisphaerales bacterium]|jgi:folate-binding protein YgfZ|nr:glycine cleavage T C-terminal barrel domain-containing protein [Phycisphaerales bacterium]